MSAHCDRSRPDSTACACPDLLVQSCGQQQGLKALSVARLAPGTFLRRSEPCGVPFSRATRPPPHLHRRREQSFDIHQHPRAVRMSLHRSYQASVLDAVEGTLGTLPAATSRINPSGYGLFDRAILWRAKFWRSWAGVVGATSQMCWWCCPTALAHGCRHHGLI